MPNNASLYHLLPFLIPTAIKPSYYEILKQDCCRCESRMALYILNSAISLLQSNSFALRHLGRGSGNYVKCGVNF